MDINMKEWYKNEIIKRIKEINNEYKLNLILKTIKILTKEE